MPENFLREVLLSTGSEFEQSIFKTLREVALLLVDFRKIRLYSSKNPATLDLVGRQYIDLVATVVQKSFFLIHSLTHSRDLLSISSNQVSFFRLFVY